jgi:Phosphoesterase family
MMMMMENRSFDHSCEGGRVEYDSGRCDGWLLAGRNDTYAIGYYTGADLAFYAKAALYWTAFDRYFSATMAETYPDRFYQHSAQTDRIHNSTAIATMPTTWDRLAAAGVSTAPVINYDERGGFFDHVAPGTAPDARPDLGTGLRGFRAPCLLISPLPAPLHRARGVRPHLGAEDDRMAVEAAAVDRTRRGSRHPGRGIRLRRPGQPRRAAVEPARLHRCAVPGRTVRGLRRLEPTRHARHRRRMAGANLRRLLHGRPHIAGQIPGQIRGLPPETR